MKNKIAYITYAINEKCCGRNTSNYYKELKKIEQYSYAQIRDRQLGKLKPLLNHAYNSTGYYKQIFDKAGFGPAGVKTFEDFQKIPLLAKADIRNNPNGFVSSDRKQKLTRYATSGSTGEPLIFYISNERIASNKAVYLMLYDWWGLNIGDREIVLWGSQSDIGAYSIAKRLRDNLLNTRLLPAFKISESTMRQYVDFIKRYKPKDIFGYAHGIYLLARFAKNRNLKLDDLGIKVVFTTAELLHDYQRRLIEEIFGCPVSNTYGGRDINIVAFECPKGAMHLNPNVLTEEVNGEIIITDLYSYGFPFIRYKTQDRGVLDVGKKCSCGSNLPIIKEILGRDTDYVVGPKGEFIHPLALEYIFRELEGIDYFRIVQKRENKLSVDLAISSKFDRNLEPALREKLSQAMGGPVDVTFNYIAEDEIPAQDKHKFVVSEVIKKYFKS